MQKKTAVFYTAHARKDLLKLGKETARRITLAVQAHGKSSEPLRRAKRLSGAMSGLYRYRVGDYRAIFQYDDAGTLHILTVLRIKHRKDIYR